MTVSSVLKDNPGEVTRRVTSTNLIFTHPVNVVRATVNVTGVDIDVEITTVSRTGYGSFCGKEEKELVLKVFVFRQVRRITRPLGRKLIMVFSLSHGGVVTGLVPAIVCEEVVIMEILDEDSKVLSFQTFVLPRV